MELKNSTANAAQDDRVEIDKQYLAELNRFTDVLERAILTSHTAMGLDPGPRRYWGSVLFTRLCTLCR
jgi:hypothetical protein